MGGGAAVEKQRPASSAFPSTHEKQRVSGSRVSICVCTLIPHSKLTFAPNIDKHRCLAADSQVRILAYFVFIHRSCMKIDFFKSFIYPECVCFTNNRERTHSSFSATSLFRQSCVLYFTSGTVR